MTIKYVCASSSTYGEIVHEIVLLQVKGFLVEKSQVVYHRLSVLVFYSTQATG